MRSWHLAAAVLLLALLAGVATLQYRWLGDVSRAERDRLQASLQSRASDFASALDTDVTRAFAAFDVESTALAAAPAATLAAAVDRAARESATGSTIKAVFMAQSGVSAQVRRFDPSTHTLVDATWPKELETLADRVARVPVLAVGGLPLPPGIAGDALDGDVPALVVPVSTPELPRPPAPDQMVVRTMPTPSSWQTLIVWLDRQQIGEKVVAPLVARHFGTLDESLFDVSVVSHGASGSVFHTGNAAIAPEGADLTRDVFTLRLSDLHWNRAYGLHDVTNVPAQTPPQVRDRVSITVVRREGNGGTAFTPAEGGAWQLRVRARQGSLDAVVAQSRRRNLAVSLGVLGILGASLVLILASAAREQRTARQQLEFVASVSHELRTPLAVIRSAGDNLADGVVSGEQVVTYGALIRAEGRRLSDMVDRVMDFAGMTTGTLIRARRDADVSELVAAAVAAVQPEAEERAIAVRIHAPRKRCVVLADADAIRSALQNAVGNAIKYSANGGEVDVDIAATDRTVRIAVSDRGIGIDAEDLPHVFRPFYRGRRAVDAQIRGSGVGLSLVQKIVDAHGGDLRIAAREGGGTVLTIELPAAVSGGSAA